MADDAFDSIRFRNLGLKGDRDAAHDSVVKEIEAEKAGALSRAVDKLQAAWDEASALGRAVGDGAASTEQYQRARVVCERARWELRIHRDALGLLWHPDYDARWPRLPRNPSD